MGKSTKYLRSTSLIAVSAVTGFILSASVFERAAKAEYFLLSGGYNNLYYKDDPLSQWKSFYAIKSLSGNAIDYDARTKTEEQPKGTTGHDGQAPFVIYGGIDIQTEKVSTIYPFGNGIEKNTVKLQNAQYDWSPYKASDSTLGGRLGGMGGGSIFGALSFGNGKNLPCCGSGENSASSEDVAVRYGRDISGNTVLLKNVALTGSSGGKGSDEIEDTDVVKAHNRGGGAGGFGGAVVIGGASIGVNDNYENNVSSGGGGGDVSKNSITLTDVILNGAAGGNGGNGKKGSGGIGGIGGGSVIGGVSIGGGGTVAEPGAGGDVHDNVILLTKVTLNGAKGGDGGSPSDDSGAGSGGLGGGSIVGGLSIAAASGFGSLSGADGGTVSGNELVLVDVTTHGAEGGKAGAKGNTGGAGHNGLEGGSVYGGASLAGAGGDGDGRPNKAGNGGNVSNNKIKISGTSFISGNIYGGFSLGGSAGTNGTTGQSGNVTGNVITLEGSSITLGKRAEDGKILSYGAIYGGYSLNGDGTVGKAVDTFSSNKLVLSGYRGTVSGIYNIQNYNWILPKDVKNGDTLITIADGGNAVDLTNTKHSIANMDSDGARLQVGDKVTMISKTQGTLNAPSPYTIKQGQFIVYNARLVQQSVGLNTALVMTIEQNTPPNGGGDDTTSDDDDDATGGSNNGTTGSSGNSTTGGSSTGTAGGSNTGNGNNAGFTNNDKPANGGAYLNPQSKAYAEGRAAALGFVSQGSDLISSNISSIRSEVVSGKSIKSPVLTPFIITGGASQRYKTGSHVDVDGFNMVAGLATGFDLEAGHVVTAGAFFEYGRGTYDTYNSFTNFSSVHGDGDSDYKGGGIFARIDFANTGLHIVNNLKPQQPNGLYADGSLRIGQSSSKFDVGRNIDIIGKAVDYRGSYDSDVTYFGGHVGGGYVFNFDEKSSLDVYGRYLWTHMDSDTVRVGTERLRIDSSTSSRIQLGGRYLYDYNSMISPYIGAAYEYEFDGDVSAKAYEFNLAKPSLEGSTGILEAGVKLKPIKANKALSVNIDGQGYIGARQGGGGGVKLKYQF